MGLKVFGHVRVLFTGVGEASYIDEIVSMPTYPKVGEKVDFVTYSTDPNRAWTVTTVVHHPNAKSFNVHCVVG